MNQSYKPFWVKYFMQFGFSSDVALDTVTSTNLIEGFSFCTEFKSFQSSAWALQIKSTRL